MPYVVGVYVNTMKILFILLMYWRACYTCKQLGWGLSWNRKSSSLYWFIRWWLFLYNNTFHLFKTKKAKINSLAFSIHPIYVKTTELIRFKILMPSLVVPGIVLIIFEPSRWTTHCWFKFEPPSQMGISFVIVLFITSSGKMGIQRFGQRFLRFQ